MTTDVQPDLIDLRDADDVRAGGKARGLAHALARGLPVPPGVVVPADVADDGLADAVAEAARRLGGPRFAVRSSARVEDAVDASFAGQFTTLLDVERDDLAEAVRTVRASGRTRRATAYAAAEHVDLDAGDLPVLVMPMLRPVAAGVAFSHDPVGGGENAVVEAVGGVGTGVVDGTAVPDRWTVTTDESVVGDGVLPAATVRRVADLARTGATMLGRPADLEFAVDEDGEVAVLQLRPATAVVPDPFAGTTVAPPPFDAPPGAWTIDRDHWSVPVPTFVASWFFEAENDAFRRLFAEIGLPLELIEYRSIGRWAYSRPRPVGAPEGATGTPPRPVVWLLSRLHPQLRARERAARTYLSTLDHRIETTLERFASALARPLPPVDDLDRLDDDALGARHRQLLRAARELTARHFELNVGVGSYVIGRFGQLAGEHLGASPLEAMAMLGSSPGSRAMADDLHDAARAVVADPTGRRLLGRADGDPADVLRALTMLPEPAGRAVRAFLADHGTTVDTRGGLLADSPAAVVAGLRAAADGDPAARDGDGDVSGDDDATRRRLAAHARGAELVTAWERARRVYPQRDRSATMLEQLIGRMGRVLDELGRRLTERGDLHGPGHLQEATPAELERLLDARLVPWPGLADTLARRDAERVAAGTVEPPTVVGGPAGGPPDPDVFPAAMAQVTAGVTWMVGNAFRTAPTVVDGDLLVGRGGSAGRYRGRARVLHDLEEVDRLEPGEVLVCHATTPTWTPALLVAGAVLTACGGALSHAAIVCRELGKPAVVGLGEELFVHVRDGDEVELDGAAGTVRRIASGA